VTANAAGHIPSSYTQFLDAAGLAGARIGVFSRLNDRDVADPQVVALVEAAVARMQALGAVVVELPEIPMLPYFDAVATTYPSLEYEGNRYLESLGDDAPHSSVREMFASGQVAPYVTVFEPLLRGDIPPEEDPLFEQLLQYREDMQTAVLDVIDAAAIDAIVYPTSLQTAPLIGDPLHGLVGADVGLNTDLSPVLAWPAITVPGGFTPDGLPVGIEFMGRAFSEGRLIQLAYAFEQATLHRRSPSLVPEPSACAISCLAVAWLASSARLRRRRRSPLTTRAHGCNKNAIR
jgi:Asp-tRNA(Asn)/Glu-tRNA(Gln) amidotransferase A subunit family amidase